MKNSWVEKLLDGSFVFEDLFNEYLIEHETQNVENRRNISKRSDAGYYYPTGIVRCYLAQFFSSRMYKTPSLTALKIFYTGNMHQDYLLSKIMEWKFGPAHKPERKMVVVLKPLELYLTGRIDDELIIPVKGGESFFYIPLEGKSQAGSLSFRKSPKLEHVFQLMTYMVALNTNQGYLVYMDRSGIAEDTTPDKLPAVTKTFHVKWDPAVWAELVFRTETIHEFITSDVVPPPESRMNKDRKHECSWCEWKKECDFLFINLSQTREKCKGEIKFNNLVELYPDVYYK